mgnify:CR=1 FL=1
MKKRIEIRQDLKRGFGSAPTGIKKFGEVVAGRFRGLCGGAFRVCLFWVVCCPCRQFLAVVVFLIRAVWRILCVFALFILVLCVIL